MGAPYDVVIFVSGSCPLTIWAVLTVWPLLPASLTFPVSSSISTHHPSIHLLDWHCSVFDQSVLGTSQHLIHYCASVYIYSKVQPPQSITSVLGLSGRGGATQKDSPLVHAPVDGYQCSSNLFNTNFVFLTQLAPLWLLCFDISIIEPWCSLFLHASMYYGLFSTYCFSTIMADE